MYGYEITQHVKEITKGEFTITEGALYPALHRLEADGILDTETKSIGNRYRKYYSLTESGEKAAPKKLAEMEDFIRSLQFRFCRLGEPFFVSSRSYNS